MSETFIEHNKQSGIGFLLDVKSRLHSEQTEYQSIEIYDTTKFGRLMVIDGCIMLTDRDNFLYHEMMSHPVLFTHDHPKDVLIIGGGDCGTMQAVLKHDSVTRVEQVEIDERVTRLSEEYFPDLCTSNSDPRASLHFVDGIKWVQDATPESYDIIIIDSTDPVGPAEGLFTAPFYRDCYKALRTGGIIVQQSESPLLHMSILEAMHRDLNASGYTSVATLFFPQTVYPSGWWSATMGGKARDVRRYREQDAGNKNFDTLYYNVDIHRAALAMPEFFKQRITTLSGS